MAAHTDNSVQINAPLEFVWERMMNVEDWPNLYDNEYASAEVLEREGDRIVFRLSMPPVPRTASACRSTRRPRLQGPRIYRRFTSHQRGPTVTPKEPQPCSASTTSVARMWVAIDQPTICRENVSWMAASYSQPSPVRR